MNDLIEKLLSSKKYRDVCPDTVRRIVAECAPKYKREKDVEAAARERLHGVTAAFMTEAEYRRALRLAEDKDFEALLACHASTRERMPIAAMDALYARIFEITGVPETLADLACGLNPAYLHWKYPQTRVTAADVSGQCVRILQGLGVDARLSDLLCAAPDGRFDAALLFKVLPLLERQKAGAADDVLRGVNAESVVVSFPTRSLSGRNVGMEENYSRWMDAHIPENRTVTGRFTTENELFYILKEKTDAEAVCGGDADRKPE